LLARRKVDEALELGVEELLGPVRADPDHLLHAGHPHARKAQVGGGSAGLDVGVGGLVEQVSHRAHHDTGRARSPDFVAGQTGTSVVHSRWLEAARNPPTNWLSPSRRAPRDVT